MAHYSIKVTTIPTQIATYNPKRVSLHFFNRGDITVFISEDQTNIVETGIPLSPYASISFHKVENDKPEVAFYAQVETGEATIVVYEVFM